MTVTTKSTYQFINLSSFRKLNFWDYYTLSNKASIFSNFPLVELGTVIKQRKESIVIDDAKIYKRCRVQLYSNGVVLRDPDGIEGKANGPLAVSGKIGGVANLTADAYIKMADGTMFHSIYYG